MTQEYLDETAKLAQSPWPSWSISESRTMHDELYAKGYWVNCVYRIGCDRKYHDAWQVERADIPRLIEQLFRHRFVVEVQAEGKGMASINFCYDYSASSVIRAVKKFWKNNRRSEYVR